MTGGGAVSHALVAADGCGDEEAHGGGTIRGAPQEAVSEAYGRGVDGVRRELIGAAW